MLLHCLCTIADEASISPPLSHREATEVEEVIEPVNVQGHPRDDGSGFNPDVVPGIDTGDDVIEFYGKYGQDSAVKFFYCNRCV